LFGIAFLYAAGISISFILKLGKSVREGEIVLRGRHCFTPSTRNDKWFAFSQNCSDNIVFIYSFICILWTETDKQLS